MLTHPPEPDHKQTLNGGSSMTATSLSLTTHTRQELEDIVKSTKCALSDGLAYLEMLQNKIDVLTEAVYDRICKSGIEYADHWGILYQDIFDGIQRDFDHVAEFLKEGHEKIHAGSDAERRERFLDEVVNMGIPPEEIEHLRAAKH